MWQGAKLSTQSLAASEGWRERKAIIRVISSTYFQRFITFIASDTRQEEQTSSVPLTTQAEKQDS